MTDYKKLPDTYMSLRDGLEVWLSEDYKNVQIRSNRTGQVKFELEEGPHREYYMDLIRANLHGINVLNAAIADTALAARENSGWFQGQVKNDTTPELHAAIRQRARIEAYYDIAREYCPELLGNRTAMLYVGISPNVVDELVEAYHDSQ